MRIIDQGTLCAAVAGTSRAVATFPSVVALPDGTLLSAYRIGATKESEECTIELRRSVDNGRTWSQPETPFPSVYDGVRGSLQVAYLTWIRGATLLACALWIDREAFPGQPLFHPETEGCLPTRILLAESRDLGRSWSGWREVAVTPDVGPPSLTNPVLRLASGKLVISLETNKPYLDRSPWVQRVVYLESDDGGRTWSSPRTVRHDPTGRVFHWDERAAVGPDGLLAAFSWSYDRVENRYLPIRRHISRDEGYTWSDDALGFADQPSHPAVLPDGRAVLTWVDRFGSRGIRARGARSLDGHFDPATEVVIYESPAPPGRTRDTAEMLAGMGLWTFGLPYAEALPCGDVLVVYYAGSAAQMDVHWARLAL